MQHQAGRVVGSLRDHLHPLCVGDGEVFRKREAKSDVTLPTAKHRRIDRKNDTTVPRLHRLLHHRPRLAAVPVEVELEPHRPRRGADDFMQACGRRRARDHQRARRAHRPRRRTLAVVMRELLHRSGGHQHRHRDGNAKHCRPQVPGRDIDHGAVADHDAIERGAVGAECHLVVRPAGNVSPVRRRKASLSLTFVVEQVDHVRDW